MQFVDGHENQDASEEFGESAEPVHVVGRVPQGLTSDISRFSLPDPAHQILYWLDFGDPADSLQRLGLHLGRRRWSLGTVDRLGSSLWWKFVAARQPS